MNPIRPLILLDRDGVLNKVVVDPEHGTIDSPLHPSQVEIPAGVPEALAQLTETGYGLAIVSNQPAWAKGKTTRENLERTHEMILDLIQARGGRILSSHFCLHRLEDGCSCRKPRTGLLEEALRQHADYAREGSWMVGDGVTDVQAGQALRLQTTFVGPHRCDICHVLEERLLTPTLWAEDLADFARKILKKAS